MVSYLKQVLHVDRNDYYGGESTSLNLTKVIVYLAHCFLIFIYDGCCLLIFNYIRVALEAFQGKWESHRTIGLKQRVQC